MSIPKFHAVAVLALTASTAGMSITAYAGDNDMPPPKMSSPSMHHEKTVKHDSATHDTMKGNSSDHSKRSDAHVKSSGMNGGSTAHHHMAPDHGKQQGMDHMKSGM